MAHYLRKLVFLFFVFCPSSSFKQFFRTVDLVGGGRGKDWAGAGGWRLNLGTLVLFFFFHFFLFRLISSP